jgi:hypothetical protein
MAALRRAADVARPVALAGEHVLPVLPAIGELLPDGGLRRGTVVAVGASPTRAQAWPASSRGGHAPPRPSPDRGRRWHPAAGPRSEPDTSVDAGGGATALALALVAGASAAGSWTAVVGAPSLGLLAAAELGVALERVAVVPEIAPDAWAPVVAALVDAVDVVVVHVDRRVRLGDARRLAARARERGSVLVLLPTVGAATGDAWPDGADVRLVVTAARWEGIAGGAGHLRARRVEVEAGGRRAAARVRRAALWLPGPDGAVAAVESLAEPVPILPGARQVG